MAQLYVRKGANRKALEIVDALLQKESELNTEQRDALRECGGAPR